jgi:hypothetical protein
MLQGPSVVSSFPDGPGRRGLVGQSAHKSPHFSTHNGKYGDLIQLSPLADLLRKLRRQARERRQYVYAKSLEAQERLTYVRKQQLKDALASGKSLPTELRKQAHELGKDLAFDEAQTGQF